MAGAGSCPGISDDQSGDLITPLSIYLRMGWGTPHLVRRMLTLLGAAVIASPSRRLPHPLCHLPVHANGRRRGPTAPRLVARRPGTESRRRLDLAPRRQPGAVRPAVYPALRGADSHAGGSAAVTPARTGRGEPSVRAQRGEGIAQLCQVHRRHGRVVLGDGSDLRAVEPEHGADRLRFGAVNAQDPRHTCSRRRSRS
jgi:hypothetical protein